MDSWLKKLNNNSNKPTADDVEAAIEADTTLIFILKKCKFNEKTRLVIPKRELIMKVFAVWFYFRIGRR